MEKIKNIEILRFLFALVIVCCHLKHGIINVEGIPLYETMCENFCWSFLPVDFFFIISGFFMFMTTNFDQSFVTFTKKKLIRFMPVILFVLAISYIVGLFLPYQMLHHENIFTILNIQNVGLTLTNGNVPASWFVSSLFWGLAFYFYLYKVVNKQMFNLITACIVFFCYSFFLHSDGTNFTNIAIVFNLGMIRAFAGIGTGYFLSVLYKDNINSVKIFTPDILQKIIISIGEIYLFCFIFYYLCLHKTNYNNPLIMIIYFIGLFILFIIRKGYFSKFLENNLSVFLGKFAFSIFLTHQFVIKLWHVCIYDSHIQWVFHHPELNLIIVWFLIISFGIMTYYLVEKPCTKYLQVKLISNV